MTETTNLVGALQQREIKRAERRHFFRKSSGFALGMAGGVILGACGGEGDLSLIHI